MTDTIAVTVQHQGAKVVGKWEDHGHINAPTGADVSIYAISVACKKGHTYLCLVSASGFMPTDSGHSSQYALQIAGQWKVSQTGKMHRGGYAGLASMPVSLSALHTATADGNVVFDFRFVHTSYSDWMLDDGHHTMVVLDLGTA